LTKTVRCTAEERLRIYYNPTANSLCYERSQQTGRVESQCEHRTMKWEQKTICPGDDLVYPNKLIIPSVTLGKIVSELKQTRVADVTIEANTDELKFIIQHDWYSTSRSFQSGSQPIEIDDDDEEEEDEKEEEVTEEDNENEAKIQKKNKKNNVIKNTTKGKNKK